MISHNKKKIKSRKITLQELNTFIKVINLDYKPKSTKELSTLINTHFNVKCTEQDILKYERLYTHYQQIEDFELESRRQEYNLYTT